MSRALKTVRNCCGSGTRQDICSDEEAEVKKRLRRGESGSAPQLHCPSS